MFPLHDNIRPRTFPWVTYTIIGLCTIAFVIQMQQGTDDSRLVEAWGMIPARVMADADQESELLVERPVIVQTNMGPQVVQQVRPLQPAAMSARQSDALCRKHVVFAYFWG
jgi:membrane associated rhomboid family serine protease